MLRAAAPDFLPALPEIANQIPGNPTNAALALLYVRAFAAFHQPVLRQRPVHGRYQCCSASMPAAA